MNAETRRHPPLEPEIVETAAILGRILGQLGGLLELHDRLIETGLFFAGLPQRRQRAAQIGADDCIVGIEGDRRFVLGNGFLLVAGVRELVAPFVIDVAQAEPERVILRRELARFGIGRR